MYFQNYLRQHIIQRLEQEQCMQNHSKPEIKMLMLLSEIICVKDFAFWCVLPQALLYLVRDSPGVSATSTMADTTWGAVK